MRLKLLITVIALTGCATGPGLADEKPLWKSTVGDLIGLPAASSTPVATASEPGSVNIEFVVDQCDASAVEPINLADFRPDPEPAAPPLPEVKPQPEPQTLAEPARTIPVPDHMDIAVVPDSVLPSLDSFVPQGQRDAIEISPSILYLP